METQLAQHLLALSTAYCSAKALGEATVGRQCASDGRFFSRIRDGKTFTAKKYDGVVLWFAINWPANVEWPHGVPRPAPTCVREAAE